MQLNNANIPMIIFHICNEASNIWQWFHNEHQFPSPIAIQSTLTTNEMQGPTIELNIIWCPSIKIPNENITTLEILKDLDRFVINEQHLIFYPII
jgi:hypothetical protein